MLCIHLCIYVYIYIYIYMFMIFIIVVITSKSAVYHLGLPEGGRAGPGAGLLEDRHGLLLSSKGIVA